MKSWWEKEASVAPEWNGYSTCCASQRQRIKGVQQGDLQSGKMMLRSGLTATRQRGLVTYLIGCGSSLPSHADLWRFLQVVLPLLPVVVLRLTVFGTAVATLTSSHTTRCWAARGAALGLQALVEGCEVGS